MFIYYQVWNENKSIPSLNVDVSVVCTLRTKRKQFCRSESIPQKHQNNVQMIVGIHQ